MKVVRMIQWENLEILKKIKKKILLIQIIIILFLIPRLIII